MWIGCMTGALCAFLLSRYLFKDYVKAKITKHKWLNPRFKIIDELLMEQGMVFMALVRLTFSPYGITSHVLGVTSIHPVHYILGCSTYIVNAVLQTFIGCSLYNVSKQSDSSSTNMDGDEDSSLETTVFLIELVLTCIITFFVGMYAKKVIQGKLSRFEESRR